MVFANLLTELLVSRNMTQSQLCKKTGLSKSIVSKLLSGTQEIRYSQILLCAKALELHPGDLFEKNDGRSDFKPIIDKYTIVRPQFEDATGRLFVYTVYALDEFTIPNVRLSVPPKSIHFVYVISGIINYNGTIRSAGEVFVSPTGNNDTLKVNVPAGSQYLICTATTKAYSFEEILKIRQKGMLPESNNF